MGSRKTKSNTPIGIAIMSDWAGMVWIESSAIRAHWKWANLSWYYMFEEVPCNLCMKNHWTTSPKIKKTGLEVEQSHPLCGDTHFSQYQASSCSCAGVARKCGLHLMHTIQSGDCITLKSSEQVTWWIFTRLPSVMYHKVGGCGFFWEHLGGCTDFCVLSKCHLLLHTKLTPALQRFPLAQLVLTEGVWL